MELLVWHEALGSDEEQAGGDEVLRRVLYSHRSDDARRQGSESGSSPLHSLHFLQGIVAFVRALRRNAAANTIRPAWVSITLAGRKLLVLEVEPAIYMALVRGLALSAGGERMPYKTD